MLGGGASGLMAAASLSDKFDTLIIDANQTLGKKLLISGGGKCNFTNRFMFPSFYKADEDFISNALNSFTSQDSIKFFENISIQERDKGKLFGAKSSKLFLDKLYSHIDKSDIALEVFIEKVRCKDGFFILEGSKTFKCTKLIVALGSPAWGQIGASDVGLKIAKDFGHSIVKSSPALSPLTLQPDQFWMKKLSGISFEVEATVGKRVLKDSILFSHKGLSGPLALDISLFWDRGSVEFNFCPNENIKKILNSNSKKQISSLVSLPKRFTKAFLESENLQDKSIRMFTEKEKKRLMKLHEYSFAPAGTLGFDKAEVSKGGVNTNEINPFTFESKHQKNLYFIGEVLNVTGALGGYNLHWAFASAKECSKYLI